MKKRNILRQWDEAARNGKFPHMGSNSHHIFGKARMLVYQNGAEWLTLIELVVFLYGIDDYANIVYVYGNEIKSPGLIDENIKGNFSTSYNNLMRTRSIRVPSKIRSETNQDFWCPDLHDFELSINGEIRRFMFTPKDYYKNNIRLPQVVDQDCLENNKAVLRILCDMLNEEDLFLPDKKLLILLEKEHLSRFLVLSDWENPGLGTVKKPSDSQSLVRLASAISNKKPEGYYCSDNETNTHWSKWPDEIDLFWQR